MLLQQRLDVDLECSAAVCAEDRIGLQIPKRKLCIRTTGQGACGRARANDVVGVFLVAFADPTGGILDLASLRLPTSRFVPPCLSGVGPSEAPD